MLATLNDYDDGGENVTSLLEEKKKEIQQKDDLISDLDAQIAKLEASLGNAKVLSVKKTVPKVKKYTYVKGDEVDEMLASYINKMDVGLPISRLGGGQYMFGSKKIYAKVMNKKLVVRVGGGYMDMAEFITTYAESERLKLQHMNPEEVERMHNGG